MCGIFAVVNDKSSRAAQTVLEGLKKLEYRGYDSWGIAIKPEGKKIIEVEKHIGKIGEAQTALPKGTIAIGHTRWATHGGVTDANAHPHLDCTKKLAVLHNGIVENYQELKSRLMQQGHTFASETDTEVIAHLIEEKRKELTLKQAVFSAFKELVGSNAICVLDSATDTVIACRNGSPLVVGLGQEDAYVASDVPAFLKFTNTVHFLLDGEAVILTRQGTTLHDISSEKEKKLPKYALDWKVEDAEKGGYPHFLLKEIMEQPSTIAKTARINQKEISKVAALIKKNKKVVMSACGTASYCTIAAKYFFAASGIDVQTYGAYEFLPFADFCDKETVFIAVSQSGETADTLIAAKEAKKRGAHIVAVVNARGSTLERLADSVLSVGAGPEIAVVSTKAFTSQLATLYLLSQAAGGMYQKAQKDIINLGRQLEHWADKQLEEKVVALAKLLINHEHAYLIGKHLNYPAAMEFALKMKEASYTHSESFAAGELKHGVIALIQKDTPCFILASNDKVKYEVLSSAAELKARGGFIIGIAPFESHEFDMGIITPDAGDLTIFPNVMVGQLLGYFLGVGKGADPDKPRNLAKSVTVK